MTVAGTLLENGIAIVTEQVPWLRSATAGIWVPVGSRAETQADSGIAHFIEHMLFKGTARRKAVDISRAIESVGGTMNAYTSREFTYFFAKAMEKDFPLIVDLLADIYRDSVFDEEELAREKSVILQEILMVDDTPEEFLNDFFNLSYWGGHPLGLPVQGTAESVGRFDRGAVVGCFRDRFRRRGIVATVVGNLPHEAAVSAFREALSPLELKEALAVSPPAEPAGGTYLKPRELEQAHLCLGAPAVARKSDRIFAMDVINAVLGGSSSSRLFQEVREKRGLAYSVGSTVSVYADAGILEIYAGTGKEQVEEVLEVAGRIVDDLREGGITDDEVAFAKDLIKGNTLLSLESTMYRMSHLAMNEMFLDRREPPEEVLARVDAVTPSQVRDLAAELLRRDRFTLAAVGDLPEGGLGF
ncbi:MAG: pitrilysin family protein [Thermodesulfobacteriota bacterium]